MPKLAPESIRGVNLSGWLVLESWATPSVFAATGAFDEEGLIRAVDHDHLVELVGAHRDMFITEDDFKRMASRGFNAVRLPIPWFVFGEKGPLGGSRLGCISYVDSAMDWARDNGMYVLLDIASAPGAIAGSSMDHNLVSDREVYRSAVLEVVGRLAARYAKHEAFLGIEPLDSPVMQRRRGLSLVEGVPQHRLRNYYRLAYDAIRKAAGPDCAVVISDSYAPKAWKNFMAHERYVNVWLDSHLYHYSDNVDATGPAGVRTLVNSSARSLEQAKTSGLPVIVGEWSSALPLADATMTPEGRVALERVYAAGQLGCFAANHAGWFFQTWKTGSRLSAWDARLALATFESGMFD